MDYKVFIKVDSRNRIITINSDAFMSDFNGWILIDEGSGDAYHHAQGNYLPCWIFDELGRYNFKYENNKVLLRTEEEKAADDEATAAAEQTQEERLTALEEALELLLKGATE